MVRGSPPRRPEIHKAGVQAITLGDHVWDQKNFNNEIDGLDYVCRPANLPANNPGRDRLIIEVNGFKVGLFTVLGRTFMGPKVDCPFAISDRIVTELRDSCDIILCEIHAETTSEKESMGWHLDGRVAMIYGTHTHVPTADGRILRGGSAYQSDLGMTGPGNPCSAAISMPVLAGSKMGCPASVRWPKGMWACRDVSSRSIRIPDWLIPIS